jgi:hypothetical protein
MLAQIDHLGEETANSRPGVVSRADLMVTKMVTIDKDEKAMIDVTA